ncbi:hypothetical protein E1265_10120 [Streptomyces sp. 8K308]|uniref:FtsB family cell division protein n=1 Tax=Streptomyces sp. 8K308 TaxID=2530388 RepID=UPI0010507C56|nr:hypothetical protein E1265_10120 [Streptomyces sp. 8K308]
MSQRQRLVRLAGLVPRGSSTAARTPFVLLVVLLLGSGMLGLLFLNASLNEGSFELSELRRETQELTDQQQELQAEVDGYSAPDALAERARELGMVPDGPPVFLGPDGTLLGDVAPRGEDTEGASGTPPAPHGGTGPEAAGPSADDTEDPAEPPSSTPPGTIVDDSPPPASGAEGAASPTPTGDAAAGAALGLTALALPRAARRRAAHRRHTSHAARGVRAGRGGRSLADVVSAASGAAALGVTALALPRVARSVGPDLTGAAMPPTPCRGCLAGGEPGAAPPLAPRRRRPASVGQITVTDGGTWS